MFVLHHTGSSYLLLYVLGSELASISTFSAKVVPKNFSCFRKDINRKGGKATSLVKRADL